MLALTSTMKKLLSLVSAVSPVLLLGVATGCGTMTYKPAVQSIGEYKNTSQAVDDAENMPEHSADKVRVLVETLPEGMGLKEGVIVYDHAQYELLGKVSASYKDPSAVNLGLWFYGYKEDERWRKGLCTWQVPISWLTLTMWSYFSPTYYPCRVAPGSEEERRADIVETLQRATKALGGNLVIVAGFGGVDFVTVNGNTGAVIASNSVSTLNGGGYAFKATGAAPTPGKKGDPATPVKGTTKL